MVDDDLFDVLDIPHREDSYSRLIVEVLRRHEDVRTSVFSNLTGHKVIRWPSNTKEAVRFREAIPKHKPDLRLEAETEDGKDSKKAKRGIPDLRLEAETENGKH
ncbi:MAG: hypothetical protein R3C68_09865 [Myxococcota bacterium]